MASCWGNQSLSDLQEDPCGLPASDAEAHRVYSRESADDPILIPPLSAHCLRAVLEHDGTSRTSSSQCGRDCRHSLPCVGRMARRAARTKSGRDQSCAAHGSARVLLGCIGCRALNEPKRRSVGILGCCMGMILWTALARPAGCAAACLLCHFGPAPSPF